MDHKRPLHAIQYSLRREINEIYWSAAIVNFALGLVGIFVPIYLFLYFNSVVDTFAFYFALFLGHVLVVPLVGQLLKYLGAKKMVATSMPFLALYLISLSLLDVYPEYSIWLLVGAGISHIIHMTFYSVGFQFDFAYFSEDGNRGKDIGTVNVLVALAKTIAPLIGGFLIVTFGFVNTFILASVLMIISSFPLFMSPEIYETYSVSWFKSFCDLFKKENIDDAMAYFFIGFEYAIALFLFPIFIYTVLGNFEVIGSITSASLVAALLFTYFIGKSIDKRGEHNIMSYASIVHAFAWIINSFIATPLQYFIYSSFLRLAEVANHLPMVSLFYRKAKQRKKGIDEYIVMQSIAHNSGRVFAFFLIVIGFCNGLSFFTFFILAATSSLFFRLLK